MRRIVAVFLLVMLVPAASAHAPAHEAVAHAGESRVELTLEGALVPAAQAPLTLRVRIVEDSPPAAIALLIVEPDGTQRPPLRLAADQTDFMRYETPLVFHTEGAWSLRVDAAGETLAVFEVDVLRHDVLVAQWADENAAGVTVAGASEPLLIRILDARGERPSAPSDITVASSNGLAARPVAEHAIALDTRALAQGEHLVSFGPDGAVAGPLRLLVVPESERAVYEADAPVRETPGVGVALLLLCLVGIVIMRRRV